MQRGKNAAVAVLVAAITLSLLFTTIGRRANLFLVCGYWVKTRL